MPRQAINVERGRPISTRRWPPRRSRPPTPDHAGVASLLTKAINAGKHVYCEKPIATNLDEAVAPA